MSGNDTVKGGGMPFVAGPISSPIAPQSMLLEPAAQIGLCRIIPLGDKPLRGAVGQQRSISGRYLSSLLLLLPFGQARFFPARFLATVDMTDILHDKVREGYRVSAEAAATLSPYLRKHIKRFGEYIIDTEMIPPPLNSDKPFLTPDVGQAARAMRA